MKNKQKGYYQVTHDMIRDKKIISVIGTNAWSIYSVLNSYINHKTQTAYPSYKTLQEATGLSRATVSKALKTLKDHGLIQQVSVGKAGGNNNTYKVNNTYTGQVVSNNNATSPAPVIAATAQPTPPAPAAVSQASVDPSRYTHEALSNADWKELYEVARELGFDTFNDYETWEQLQAYIEQNPGKMGGFALMSKRLLVKKTLERLKAASQPEREEELPF